jgi:hypothetical protein
MLVDSPRSSYRTAPHKQPPDFMSVLIAQFWISALIGGFAVMYPSGMDEGIDMCRRHAEKEH